jgi:hypothetical protein
MLDNTQARGIDPGATAPSRHVGSKFQQFKKHQVRHVEFCICKTEILH